MNLYELSEEYRSIENDLYELGGDATPELEERLAINKDTVAEKFENYAKVIANLEGDMEACEAELHRLNNLKYSKHLAIERLRKALLDAIILYGDADRRGILRIETPLFKFSTRKSEAVHIINEAWLPDECVNTQTVKVPDKNKIKELCKQGKTIAGAELQSKLNLQIR